MTDSRAAAIEEISRKYTDDGRIIEAGWQAMRLVVLSPAAPEIQVVEMRKAFFAGAQHLFASIMAVLDDDGTDEPSPDDLVRMALISAELEGFANELRRQAGRSDV